MIAIDNLSITNGMFRLDDVSLRIPGGGYGVLMGKTGCGKTTVLEVICGLRRPERGTVTLMGKDVTHVKTAERGIGYVPQDNALFTTMTVRENLSLGLRVRKWPRPRIDERIDELSRMLGIGDLLKRRAVGLSGGEAQRVALGRALAYAPSILCLDEPLSSLDRDTREDMCRLLGRIQRQTGVTTVHVTHDWTEGRALGDRLFVFADGHIEERPFDHE